jgi:hypothetical protein
MDQLDVMAVLRLLLNLEAHPALKGLQPSWVLLLVLQLLLLFSAEMLQLSC